MDITQNKLKNQNRVIKYLFTAHRASNMNFNSLQFYDQLGGKKGKRSNVFFSLSHMTTVFQIDI